MSKEKKQLRIPTCKGVDKLTMINSLQDQLCIYHGCGDDTPMLDCGDCLFDNGNIEEFKEWFNKVEFR